MSEPRQASSSTRRAICSSQQRSALRASRRLEKQIARRAANDAYRGRTEDAAAWEGKYDKPAAARFQTMIGCNDVHDLECDPFWRRVFIDTIKRAGPAKVVLDGDIFGLYEFSRFPTDPREVKILERIKWIHGFLAEIRAAAPDAEIVFVEGNHEFRLLRHLAEATPAMRVILSDLYGFTVPKLLGLDAWEVNFIARADLAAFTERDVRKELGRNYWIGNDCVLAHHFPEGRQMGMPGWNGHHHSHQVWQSYSPVYGPYERHQFGCGHRRAADREGLCN